MRIGVDLGGTKIEALALADSGEELWRHRVPTPKGDYEAIVNALVELITLVESQCGQKGQVGIGIPGSLSPATGLVRNANTQELIGHPLDRDVGRRLNREIRVANDANCFALSEATDGAAAGAGDGTHARVVFGVIVGTGTGGGIVVDGKLLVGADGVAGEWGHTPLPWMRADECPPPICWCGRAGCLELYLSGPGMARDHKLVTGVELSAKEIAAKAAQGDTPAVKTLERLEERLARSLAAMINVFNPDVVVLGGGISNIERLYDNVPQLWEPHVFSDVVSTKLVQAKHGDSSGVRGAAWLWPRH